MIYNHMFVSDVDVIVSMKLQVMSVYIYLVNDSSYILFMLQGGAEGKQKGRVTKVC